MTDTTMAPATPFTRMRADVQARILGGMDERIARLDWGTARLAAHQRNALRALLAHAVEHSPFHRSRLAGVDPTRFELDDLARLPVMTKTDMMDDLDAVFTDRALRVAEIERALAATTAEPVPVDGTYVAMASGGSSGRRGVFVYDRDALAAFFSALSRALVKRLRALGGPPSGGLPIAMVAAGSAVHATGAAPAWADGGTMPFRFHSVPATQPLPDIVARLNAIDAPALYGYPTMLCRLAAEREAGRLTIAPIAITSTSETLTDAVRERVTAAFGVPIVNTFGSTEGLVGQSLPGEDVLAFNSDMCIVELVDEHDEPVAPGVPSAKVLVTNLTNRVQPLVRYVLGDSFRQHDGTTDGHLRATVIGRRDDVLHYGTVDVHPLVVRGVMAKQPAVADYQVRQTARGADVAVLLLEHVDTGALGRMVADALERAGLEQPEVSVRVVDALAPHPETAKLQRFVPLR